MSPTRLNFYSIFKVHPNGSIEPMRVVRIGWAQFWPWVQFGAWVSFGGINLFQYIGRDFQAEDDNGVLVLTGIY